MTKTLNAVYDGKAFWPEEPLDLSPETKVRLTVYIVKKSKPQKESFLQTARSLKLEGSEDWSSSLEDYLYGERKDEQ
ncbi:hypothetical protein DK28_0201005 [Peptococcaceae bacterium SCADC1_2_3]|nr:hypothetical protein DK28_0201005 [Peptococcaceae bacterium SCADC1_2_3]KFI34791.1 hypothetical protein HY00_09700 [Peptococcaceae bacterium SCADC1_2_3]